MNKNPIYIESLTAKHKRSPILAGGVIDPYTKRSYSRLHPKTFHDISCWEDGKRICDKFYPNWKGIYSQQWFEDRRKAKANVNEC